MTRYVPAEQQLVVEVFTRDIEQSVQFYVDLGFEIAEYGHDENFAALKWEEHLFFLEQRSDIDTSSETPQANVRIMVPDVDACWQRVQAMNARVFAPIANRYYGLRDFTILDPNGLGLRFATRPQSSDD